MTVERCDAGAACRDVERRPYERADPAELLAGIVDPSV